MDCEQGPLALGARPKARWEPERLCCCSAAGTKHSDGIEVEGRLRLKKKSWICRIRTMNLLLSSPLPGGCRLENFGEGETPDIFLWGGEFLSITDP